MLIENIPYISKIIWIDKNINNEENKFFRRRLHRPNARPTFYSDISLSDVSMLVKDSYNRINFTLSKINENLSENLLKSFLDVDHIANAHQLLAYAYKLSPNERKKIKADYTDVLKIIKKWDSTTEEKITEFFNSLLSDMDNQKKEFRKNNNGQREKYLNKKQKKDEEKIKI